jgi:hypothetical protein
MTKRIARTLCLGLGAALLLPAVGLAEKAPELSGFLSDYSKLAVDPEEKEARLIYKNPAYHMGDFDALYLEELVFYLYPQEEATAIDAEEAAKMLELAKQFDDVFREELASVGATLVDEPGSGVLHCRWAITNLGKTKSVMRVVPQARAMGALTGVGRGAAAMEGECLDGESGEVVAQIVRADKGKKSSGVTSWAGAESAVRVWAHDLAERIAAQREEAGGSR